MATTKTTAKKSAPAKAPAATKTVTKVVDGARKAKAEPTTFDAKANKQRTLAERSARAAGEKAAPTTRHTVAPGRFVRQGGVRFGEGEAIDLSAADAERLVARGTVLQGDAGSKKVQELSDAQQQANDEKEAADAAQRAADEQAAADKAAAQEAAGQLSGAENR